MKLYQMDFKKKSDRVERNVRSCCETNQLQGDESSKIMSLSIVDCTHNKLSYVVIHKIS